MDNTKEAAMRIKAEFERLANVRIELFDVTHTRLKMMEHYERLLIGIPTWDIGNLQADWDNAFPQFAELNLASKQVALD